MLLRQLYSPEPTLQGTYTSQPPSFLPHGIDHEFDLALSLNDPLDTALQITHTILKNESKIKWKMLGDRALTVWRFDLAKVFREIWRFKCFDVAFDVMGDRYRLKLLAGKVGLLSQFLFCLFNVLIEFFGEERPE